MISNHCAFPSGRGGGLADKGNSFYVSASCSFESFEWVRLWSFVVVNRMSNNPIFCKKKLTKETRILFGFDSTPMIKGKW